MVFRKGLIVNKRNISKTKYDRKSNLMCESEMIWLQSVLNKKMVTVNDLSNDLWFYNYD